MSEEIPDYIEARLYIQKETEGDFTNEEIDSLLEDVLDFMESRGLGCGGTFGPPIAQDKECGHCAGSGLREFISPEDRCETCGGSGLKEEKEPVSDPEAIKEWNDLYAPVAQMEESPSPKGKVEGSSPSGSAKCSE